MRCLRLIVIACLAPVVLGGCHTEAPTPPPELRIVRRLIDQGFRTAPPPFTRRGFTVIGETRKLAVAAADPMVPEVSCVPASLSSSLRRPCTVGVPDSVSPIQTLILETESLPRLRSGAKGIPLPIGRDV